MKRSLIPLSILVGTLAASGTALADDNEAFRDFVKYGEGSTSENRFASDEPVPAQAMKQQDKAQQVQNKAASSAQNRDKVETATRSQDRVRTESRLRIHEDSSMKPQRGHSASGSRGSGRKGGGKR